MPKSTKRRVVERKPASRKPFPMLLTETQRDLLSVASKRTDGAATLPVRMNKRAAEKSAATLIERGLAREVRANAETPVWRRSEDGRSFALVVTKLGRQTAKSDIASAGGHTRVDGGADKMLASSPQKREEKSFAVAAFEPSGSFPRAGTKIADVIALLARKQGAAIEELVSTTGWLPHTTRAALTGLRKRGHQIERTRSEKGGAVYRIVTPLAA